MQLIQFFSVSAWLNDELKANFAPILDIKKYLNSKKAKKSDDIWIASLNNNELKLPSEDLSEIWQVASVKIVNDLEHDTPVKTFETILDEFCQVAIVPSDMKACPRCRLFASQMSDELCLRCRDVIKQ